MSDEVSLFLEEREGAMLETGQFSRINSKRIILLAFFLLNSKQKKSKLGFLLSIKKYFIHDI